MYVKYTLPIRVIESTQGPASHIVQQHIPLTQKRHHWKEQSVLQHTSRCHTPLISSHQFPKNKPHPFIRLLYASSRHIQGPHSSTTEQIMHSHIALLMHCATSSRECNIKVLITGTCKRGALGIRVDCIMELCNQNKFPILLQHSLLLIKMFFLINPWEGGRLGKRITVSHRGLVWCPRTLPFLVESRNQNKLNSMTFQYTSMANEVSMNGANKMVDFNNDEGTSIYLFRYRFVKLVTIIHVASSRDVLDSVIKQYGMYIYAHNRVLVYMSSHTTGDSGYMLHCMYTVSNDTTHLVLHVNLCTHIQ